jgi:transposase
MSNVRFVGLDVHAETIAVAVAEPNGEVRSLGITPNRAESIGRLIRKLASWESPSSCACATRPVPPATCCTGS